MLPYAALGSRQVAGHWLPLSEPKSWTSSESSGGFDSPPLLFGRPVATESLGGVRAP